MVLLAAIAGPAFAQKFEDLAAKAVPVQDADALGALFWAQSVDCAKSEDDLLRRQCEGIRDARAEAASGKVYSMYVESGAFFAGDWDAAKSGVPVGVRGCLACAQALDIGGERRFVTTKGASSVAGGALRGPEVHKAVRVFKDKGFADKWKSVVVPRLRTQILFKVPPRVDTWDQDGARGFSVEMVAFRVYDPCDGAMICANPPSANEAADRTACRGGMASGTEIEAPVEKPIEKPVEAPKEPELPEKLNTYQIKQAMQSQAVPAVNSCFATYGVPGRADLMVRVGGDGAVKNVELEGDFADTPTGECIIKAVKATEFPKFKRETMDFPWLFNLR
jgi:hypothetical protein